MYFYIQFFPILKTRFYIILLLFSVTFTFVSCKDETKEKVAAKPRVFEGFHPMLDEIILTKDGLFRGLNLNDSSAKVKRTEKATPVETTPGHLFFEYRLDSATNYSIDYTVNNDSLEEINLQVNSNDLELISYLFCDFKDYYANKLPNPTEDQGSVVYNCFEGQRKPFCVSLSDNSSPTRGRINMVIYKDQ